MKRVLFVDDEPRILEGLQRMLRSQRREWEMVFAEGADAALRAFEASPFDVVVTDMRMPGMDGATLLAQVRERFPETVRIILSGHTDQEAAVRATRVAHQFLTKPTDASVVKETINRACDLRIRIDSPTLRAIIGRVDSLPVVPAVHRELRRALDQSEVSVDALADLAESDLAITTKLLQLVNSSFFGTPREVASVRTAIQLLGIKMIKSLVVEADTFRVQEDLGAEAVSWIEDVRSHSVATARLAVRLMEGQGQPNPDGAWLAGMLHDVGKLILMHQMGREYQQVVVESGRRNVPLHVVEAEVLGATHAEVGAYLLSLWHLPVSVVEAVAFHHTPSVAEGDQIDLLTAVHVANALVRGRAEHGSGNAPLDPEYLRRVGAVDRLDRWRAAAAAPSIPA